MSDWWNQPTQPGPESAASAAEAPSTCPWCAQPATPDGSYCIKCGAALTQRDDLGGLVVPGVTGVDPAMQPSSYTSSLLKAQSRASTLSIVHTMGGPTAQIVVAASMLAKDGLSGMGGSVDPETVGKPSQAALEMASRLRSGGAPTRTPSDDPAGAADGLTDAAPAEATHTETESAAPAHDPWFDLPSAASDPEARLDPSPSEAGPSIDPAHDPRATAQTLRTDNPNTTQSETGRA
jgi:hypothetical protein